MKSQPTGGLNNLPQQLTPFIGRQEELAELTRLLADPSCRLLTLLGPGGVGKTRLAIQSAGQIAADFADGVHFVPLQSVETIDFLIAAITDAVHLPLSGPEAPRRQLLNYLRDKELLLLLDNFEQLLSPAAAGPELITEILETAPAVKLLVTSRELLNLQYEWLYPVPGLPVPLDDHLEPDLEAYSAVQLFSERAGRVRRDFSLVEEQADVIRICRLVEGMPLALELAAAWTKTLSCAEIAAEIQRNLDFLTSSRRDLPDRQRSMRAIFEQSWQLLSDHERDVFQRLSVFRGSFERRAAERVAGASLAALSTLVDKSLLRAELGGRYQIHELLHQYAAEHLVKSPQDVARVYDRHCTYYADFLAERADDVLRVRQREAVAEIKAELENIRAAWQWAIELANVQAIRNMAGSLDAFYQYQSRFVEGFKAMAQATQQLDTLEPTQERDLALAELLVYQGWFHIRLGQFEQARVVVERSRAIYSARPFPPPPGLGTDPRNGLAILAIIQGDYEEAFDLGEQVRQASAANSDKHNLAFGYYILTSAAAARGEYERAYQYSKQAYELLAAINERWFMAYCLNEWGNVARAMGDYAEARQHYQASYTIRQEFADPEGMAVALNHLGKVATLEKNYAEAKRLYHQGLSGYREINDRGGLAASLSGLAVAYCAEGDHVAARRYFHEALQITTDMHFVPLTLSIIAELAELQFQTGRAEQALELLALVRHHPASDRETQDRAARALIRYQADVSPDLLAAATGRGETLELDRVARRILAELAEPVGVMATDEPENRQVQEPVAGLAELANASLVEPLTDRELEVLQLIAAGLTNQQIADELIISVGTAKWYTGQIYGKLNVSTRTQAVARARKLSLLP